jgi:hypothetical protein
MLLSLLTRRLSALAAVIAATVLIPGAATAAADVQLAGQWRFDEPSGQTALDDGPFKLNGTLGATAASDTTDPARVSGPASGALHFSGKGYVHVADDRRLDLPTLTVEAVTRAPASPGTYRYLVSHGSVDCFAGAYGLYTAANGGLAFYVYDGERYFVAPSAAPTSVWDGKWHRVTGTFDGQRVRTYVDGREVGTGLATPAGTAIEFLSMPPNTYFGTYLGACQLPFAGDLDAVQVWSGVGAPSVVTGTAPTIPITLGTPGAPPVAGASTPVAAADNRPLTPGLAGKVILAHAPKRSCAVRVSRRKVLAGRRQSVTITAADHRGPLRRKRLTVRRAGAKRVLASPRTDSKGRARLVLRQRVGRVRIGVLGRPACIPAFVRVATR